MKALIFNSGRGSRLGALTADRPKCLVRLDGGETILHRQLRILHECGIREFVITTGPFPQLVREEARPFQEAGCSFAFVANPRYAETNYLYSLWLARDALGGGDILMLHGDLVFDRAYAKAVVDAPPGSLGSVDPALPLPEKDFKARVRDGCVREVSVGISDAGCAAFQPFYRLTDRALGIWLDAVGRFVEAGETGVYAEDAANGVFDQMDVRAFDYGGHLVEEVDTPADLERVSAAIRRLDFAQQPVFAREDGALGLCGGFFPGGAVGDLPGLMRALRMERPLLVSGRHLDSFPLKAVLDAAGVDYVRFSAFSPNPTADEVRAAVRLFQSRGCDSLLSIGGGSAIDVAKCVKWLSAAEDSGLPGTLPAGEPPFSALPHVAVPTTAGTGSESTHFAVVYENGVKRSVAGARLMPDAAVLDASLLEGLPDYQRKCTMLDALCQAVESHWSTRSDEESRAYSRRAIPGIMGSWRAYLAGDAAAAARMLRASNLAGKAINLTTTTAAHAMSYKLTSLFRVPHGHAVALCMPHVWRALLDAAAPDPQGRLAGCLREVASLLCGGTAAPEDGLLAFGRLVGELDLPRPDLSAADADALAASVNSERLSNFPLALSPERIRAMYADIISGRPA